MKLLIMQFSPTSCHFISLRSKYSPQHPVLKHPQSIIRMVISRGMISAGHVARVIEKRNAYKVLVGKQE
jgi:hypothetical protein